MKDIWRSWLCRVSIWRRMLIWLRWICCRLRSWEEGLDKLGILLIKLPCIYLMMRSCLKCIKYLGNFEEYVVERGQSRKGNVLYIVYHFISFYSICYYYRFLLTLLLFNNCKIYPSIILLTKIWAKYQETDLKQFRSKL